MECGAAPHGILLSAEHRLSTPFHRRLFFILPLDLGYDQSITRIVRDARSPNLRGGDEPQRAATFDTGIQAQIRWGTAAARVSSLLSLLFPPRSRQYTTQKLEQLST